MGQSKRAYEILLNGEVTFGEEVWDFWLIRCGGNLTTEQVWEIAPSTDVMDRVDDVELRAFAEQYEDQISGCFPIVGLCRAGESPILLWEKGTFRIIRASGRQPYWADDCSFLFLAPPTPPLAA